MEDTATAEQWQAYIDTNLSAPFWMSQAVIPFMKAQNSKIQDKGKAEQKGVDREKDIKRRAEFDDLPKDLHGQDKTDEGGCILHISSFRAHQSDPDCEGYGSTKAGLLGLTQSMAVSCQRWGIRVNMISPGWVSVAHECEEGDEAAAGTQGAPHEDDAKNARLEMWAGNHSELHHRQHLVGRVGQGEDIAEAIEYAMGAGFMSGQVRFLLLNERYGLLVDFVTGDGTGWRSQQEEESGCIALCMSNPRCDVGHVANKNSTFRTYLRFSRNHRFCSMSRADAFAEGSKRSILQISAQI